MERGMWAMSCFLKLDIQKKKNGQKRCAIRVADEFGCLNLHMLHRERVWPCSFLAPHVQSSSPSNEHKLSQRLKIAQ